MTNEEKALEIQHNDPCCVWNDGCPNVRNGAMKMAQWKDEQLESKLMQIIILAQQGYTSGATDEMILRQCKEIIKELF